MRTFIHHNGALGDTLLSLPCIRKLSAQSSCTHIAARRDVSEFLKQTGIVQGARSSGDAFFTSLYADPDQALLNFLRGFDRAYYFSVLADSPAATGLRRNISLTRVICTVPPQDVKGHAASYRLSQLGPGLQLSELPPLTISHEHLAHALSILKKDGFEPGTKIVSVHPGSGSRAKCWPLERYFDLIARLQFDGTVVSIIFSGPAEDAEFKKRIEAFALGRRNIFHARDVSLITAASLLSVSCVYIGNDSGFTHLAAATGCTTIALFGPTDPAVWKPIGPRVEVISSPNCSLDDISVEMVLERAGPLISEQKREGSAC